MYFTASAGYVRALTQRYKQTSEIHKVYFNVFYSERRLCSRFSANIPIKWKICPQKVKKIIYNFSAQNNLIIFAQCYGLCILGTGHTNGIKKQKT